MKKILFMVVVLVGMSQTVYAQDSFNSVIDAKIAWDRENISPILFPEIQEAKFNLILDLIESSQTITNLQSSFRQMYASASVEDQTKMYSALNMSEIIQEIIPIYDRYYSVTELQDIVVFYQSESGKKMLTLGPKIAQEAVLATANYFQSKL